MRRALLRGSGVLAGYLLLACLITWPLVTDLSGVILGFEYGDGYETVHHAAWFGEALRDGRSPFFASALGYPDGIDGVTLWAHPLQTFPAWAIAPIVGGPAAVNSAALLTLALNGLALFALVRRILAGAPLSDAAAWVAGAAYVMFPTIQGHLGAGHSGMIVQWPLVLFALAGVRLIDGARYGVALTAALFILSAWGHSLQIVYATLPVAAVLLLVPIVRRDRLAVRRLLLALALGAIGLGLFLIPVARAALTDPAYIEVGGMVRYSADLLAPFTPSPLHPLYGALLGYPARVLGVNLDEGAAYLGIVGGLLTLVALLRVRAARIWGLLAVCAFGLALGPLLKAFDAPVIIDSDGLATHIVLPFGALADLPGASLLRTPARFNLAYALAVCVLIGLGTQQVIGGFARRQHPQRTRAIGLIAALTLTLALGFDYWTFAPFPTTPAPRPEAVTALADRPDLRAVLDVPTGSLIAAKRGLYLRTLHGLPLIAGQVTRQTPVDPAKLAILQATLDPAHLRAAGADAVIVHVREDADGVLLARARDRLGEPIYADGLLAIFLTPATDATPVFTALPPPDGVAIAGRLTLPTYSPSVVGALLSLSAAAPDGPRTLIVRTADGAEAGRYPISGSAAVQIFLPIPAGYGAVTLAADPPCATPPDPTLTCRRLLISDVTLTPG